MLVSWRPGLPHIERAEGRLGHTCRNEASRTRPSLTRAIGYHRVLRVSAKLQNLGSDAHGCVVGSWSGNRRLHSLGPFAYVPQSSRSQMRLLTANAIVANYSCLPTAETCTGSENMGWRYVYFTAGAIILVMSILRVTVIRFHETPKFSLCHNKDETVIRTLEGIAKRYNRPFSLTLEQLKAAGTISSTHAKSLFSFGELALHYRGLFETRQMALSTTLVWFSWALIGLAYPLFYIFLPEYLSSRGVDFGAVSAYITWRDYAITKCMAIPGPIIAGYMCKTKTLGRRYTMSIGATLFQ